MSGEMQIDPQPDLAPTIVVQHDEQSILVLDILEIIEEQPIFSVIDDEIEVSHATASELLELTSQLEKSGLPKGKADGFVKRLAKSFDGRFSEIFGFRAVPPGEGNTDL